ncbi:MAG TPA: ferrochelatase, partial [Limnochordia bacterium]
MSEAAPGAWALLVMAYGSPERPEEILPYYTDIRRGRPPTPELLAELEARYAAIGGSPLNALTRQQAEALAKAASERLGVRFVPYVGMRHWHPRIAAAVEQIVRAGHSRAVALVMAPQYSRMSVEVYLETARQAAAGTGLELITVPQWYDAPGYVAFMAERVREAIERLPAAERGDAVVLFTAHSLPERITTWDDPYPAQVEATARAVAERAGVTAWRCAYQSAGRTPEPWLGPDLSETLASCRREGRRAAVVCPVGFVADHLEVLYDIDIEAQATARELGIHLERARSMNTD